MNISKYAEVVCDIKIPNQWANGRNKYDVIDKLTLIINTLMIHRYN